jgi:hypothetical protein
MSRLRFVSTVAAALVLATGAWAHVQLITVTLSQPTSIDLLAGSDYQLHFVNDGDKARSFSAAELFAAGTIGPNDRAKVKNGAVEVDAHASVDIRFVPSRKGTYKFGATGTATVE